MKNRFGLHVSIAGGVEKAPERAANAGCETLQLFISNPRSWAVPKVSDTQAETFRLERDKYQIDPVTVHATYLPNLASPDSEMQQKSFSHILSQYKAAAAIGADYFVLHPGSHKGDGLEGGVQRIASSLFEISKKVPDGPMWLLENTAGGGDTIGRDAQELAAIFSVSKLPSEKIGICLDTCHAFAMGIDISKRGGFQKFITSCEKMIYPGCVKLIHLNDSKFELGAGRDRHGHIGLGEIGAKGMRSLFAARSVKGLPVVLETPVDESRDDSANLDAAREYAG